MHKRWITLALMALMLATFLAPGCSSPKEVKPLEEPPTVDQAELEREKAAQEAQKRAEAEAQAQREAQQAFGKVEEPPPPPPVEKAPPGSPCDQAVPPLPAEPTVRIAVLSDADQQDKGDKVALIVGTYQKAHLEKELGMAVKIAYISFLRKNITHKSVIHYRPNYLKAAMAVASVLPEGQAVDPMTPDERKRLGVDLLIYVGRDYR